MPNVWRISYSDPDMGTIVEWFETKAEWAERKRELRRDDPEVTFYEVDTGKEFIPAGRAALVKWLNENLSRNNG